MIRPSAESGGPETGCPECGAPIVVGVLSDTHGHLYPDVKQSLQGVDHIVHAGDIGSARVLTELKAIAPVTAVRGNCDLDAWARPLPTQAGLDLGGAHIVVRHIASSPRSATTGEESGVVITGHTHLAALEERDGIVHLNPGSAGPRRFGRPRTLARLVVHAVPAGGSDKRGPCSWVSAEIITLPDTE